jgi:8-oxo-dGTP pyrophosphatase MutT (NUDIX family)
VKDSNDPETIRRAITDHSPGIIGESSVIKTAVLIPLTQYSEDKSVEVVFQRRSEDLEIQPGDVCFPGGFRDSEDSSLRGTAVRETAEELGIPEETITVWKEFDSMLVPWELEIRSYVGWLEKTEFRPDETEVEEVFTVPLKEVRDQDPQEHEVELVPDPGENFPFNRIPGGRDYDWRPRRVPELFYEFKGRTVWGITARILRRFVDVLEP